MTSYFEPNISDAVLAGTLADWCDTLEDWPVSDIRAALREWRNKNPDKRPNPSHISGLLQRKRYLEWKASLTPNPEPERIPVTREQAKQICEEVGFKLNKFGGILR